ncbi:MAG: Na/Pi cotransporter family protein [Clostridia bacterium]|nr:Na/Pi cotransporter family protein [Clostridia bacterium]
MDIFSLFTLFGGLAIFLFGMNVMGDALEKQAGGKLKHILEDLTSTPIKGVLLGAAVTAVIQSSSATTVMVVGFVNSGIMQLSQSVGIIMGANIGTTITAWILSLAGIEGDNFFIKLLKPAAFSMILAFIGIIMNMFLKNEKKKNIGAILLGFAVLMTGMEMMSGAVKPLADVPEFRNILVLFTNPIMGVLAGAFLTAVIQSSSASVGILQAISLTGSLSFSAAIPIIMGQNIGTCATALLSAIGANKNARRAAAIHLCFNIIGSLVFLVIYYIIDVLVGFPFADDMVGPAQIAITHSIFNVFATLLLLPFSKLLVKLAYVIVKDKKQDSEEGNAVLDVRFLQTPSIAIEQCKKITCEMAVLAEKSFNAAVEMTKNFDDERAKKIKKTEDIIDKYEDMLGSYLLKLGGKNLTAAESREVTKLLHTIGDFERIGDHALNVLDAAEEIKTKSIVFTPDAVKELDVIENAVAEILKLTVESFERNDTEKAKQIEPLEQVVDKLRYKLKERHVERLRDGNCTIETGFVFSDLLTNFERISDHCSNVAVTMLQVESQSMDTHEYLSHIKADDSYFREMYGQYKAKYSV